MNEATTILTRAGPYDQFHGRGLEATEVIAALLNVDPADWSPAHA